MKRILHFTLSFLLIFAFTGCGKDVEETPSTKKGTITYEFTTSAAAKFALGYVDTSGSPQPINIQAKTWTKTIDVGSPPHMYLLSVVATDPIPANQSIAVTLRILHNGKEVKKHSFNLTSTNISTQVLYQFL